jgi:hypothetical protein
VTLHLNLSVGNRFGEALPRAVLDLTFPGGRRDYRISVTMGGDGNAETSIPDFPMFPGPVSYHYSVRWSDEHGVVWGHSASGTINPISTGTRSEFRATVGFALTMRAVPQGADAPEVDHETRRRLLASEELRFIHEAYEESRDAYVCGLPNASAALAGKCVETAILVRGSADGWPVATWQQEHTTLGGYLGKGEVRKAVLAATSETFYELLRGSNLTRIVGAHEKFESVHMDDARATLRAVTRLLDAWFGAVESGESPCPPTASLPRGR